ncbi:MAG: hypothetical protein ACRC62_13045 [Microcoleus sp.]
MDIEKFNQSEQLVVLRSIAKVLCRRHPVSAVHRSPEFQTDSIGHQLHALSDADLLDLASALICELNPRSHS